MKKKFMRNPNGFGSVHKLSGNRRKPWRVRVTKGYTPEGKQEFINVGYAESRAEAMTMLVKFNEKPWNLETDVMNFKTMYETWLSNKGSKLSEKTLREYGYVYKYVIPIERLLFKDIKTIHLQKVIDSIEKGRSTKARVKQMFSSMYSFALENDFVDKNYATFVVLPEKEEAKKSPFSYDEISRIMNMEDEQAEIVKILLFTGVRIQELLLMRNENVHLEEGYMVGGSKTKAGKNRVIPISSHIKDIVKKWYNPDNEYLLTNALGYTYKYKKCHQWWAEFIPNHTPHDTRHTFISVSHSADLNELLLKRIVGHASHDMTQDVYTHKSIQQLIQEMKKYDKFISTKIVY